MNGRILERVFYPGLPNHPGHQLAKEQARGFGGMISFDVGSKERAEQVLERTRLFTLAESLGAVESLISVPGSDDPCLHSPRTQRRVRNH